MRKIIVFENVTLDGFMAGPKGELDWEMIRDDEAAQYAKEGQSSTDTILLGRVTYDMMAGFWPTPAAASQHPIFTNFMNDSPKVVFSRTLKKADWKNTIVVKEINKEEILKMKQQPGKNMIIFGSGSIVNQLADLGLIDEYQLMVNPVILGKGKPLFNDVKDRINLKLLKARTFKSGGAALHYELEKDKAK